MLRGLIFIFMLCFASVATAQRPAAFVPSDPDTVIERLPRGYSAVLAMPQSSASPSASMLEQARALLAAAAQTGDARLASRADALLSRFPFNDGRPDVLRMRAFSAQHRHDFAAAGHLLDRLIARDPRAGDARLARAQIHVIGGRLDAARADCVALVLEVDAGDGMLCVAMLSLRQGQYPAAAGAMDRWLAQNADGDRSARRYALTLRGEIAARARDRDAGQYFQQALALMPEDVRTLAAYARFLRGAGRARDVDALLGGHPEHEGLQLQRALALRETDPAKAAAIAAGLARSYASARSFGRVPELRDEAELMLTFRRDPQSALTLAQRNVRDQRDEEDVDLLIRAATAARQPQALQPLQAWAAAQRLSLPKTIEVRP
jgi:uncharacterized tellurite resistance protein B-like protein